MKTRMVTRIQWRVFALTTICCLFLASSWLVPREAEATHTSCGVGEVCMWSGTDYTGCFNDLVPLNTDSNYSNGSPTWNNCTVSMNDRITSYWNRSRAWMVWYSASNYGQWMFCAAPGASSNYLSAFRGQFGTDSWWYANDVFSAHTTTSARPSGCEWVDAT